MKHSLQFIKWITCPSLKGLKIKPEQKLSIDLANEMRSLTLEGKYKGVWFAVPNEGKRTPLLGKLMRAMGLLSGVSDFVFITEHNALLVELKADKGRQSDNQKLFEQWCSNCGLRYLLAYSVNEVLEVLRQEDML